MSEIDSWSFFLNIKAGVEVIDCSIVAAVAVDVVVVVVIVVSIVVVIGSIFEHVNSSKFMVFKNFPFILRKLKKIRKPK